MSEKQTTPPSSPEGKSQNQKTTSSPEVVGRDSELLEFLKERDAERNPVMQFLNPEDGKGNVRKQAE